MPQRMQKHEALLPEGADARFGSIDLQSLIDRKKKTIEKRKQRLDRKRTLQNASESGSTSGTHGQQQRYFGLQRLKKKIALQVKMGGNI